ncbi:unnamed protein product [Acanthoscelides obtectus]|uniref:THAP-type domain-containing protein n=1 Tax=Acanthoscelides obtectus TaxID=200917 RepID=A0A9P0JLL6_ACAOB|nr:unnamed protein product [Acanthoscelides obtectus]CAK1654368.1 hypothetical protein AOBTE_LOCUS18547 [Acanthoscelides obtectus]
MKKLRQPSTGFLINDLPLHAFICANHFHKSDLIDGKRTQLKHSAVPSVEPLRQTDDSSDEENEINLAQEIALSHSNSEQLESRDLPRTNKVTRSSNRNGM